MVLSEQMLERLYENTEEYESKLPINANDGKQKVLDREQQEFRHGII